MTDMTAALRRATIHDISARTNINMTFIYELIGTTIISLQSLGALQGYLG